MKAYIIRAAIVLGVILVAVTGFLYISRDAQTSYDADVKIMVDQPSQIAAPGGAAGISKIVQLVPTYAEVVLSYSTAQAVAGRLSGVTPEDVHGSLSATPIKDTQILVIQAHSNDAEKTINIATETSNVFIDRIEQQDEEFNVKPEDRMVLTVVEPASYVRANVPARTRTAEIVALVAALVSISGIAVFENARSY